MKPNACGSSFGVTKISKGVGLVEAIETARAFDSSIIVEEYVDAIELFVGVMGCYPDLKIAPPVVDTPARNGIYTYFDKYISSQYEDECPSDLPDAIVRDAEILAENVYNVLGCNSYARVDLFYLPKENRLLFNELNSSPLLAPESSFSLGMSVLGYSYNDLIECLVNYAFKERERTGKQGSMHKSPNLRKEDTRKEEKAYGVRLPSCDQRGNPTTASNEVYGLVL